MARGANNHASGAQLLFGSRSKQALSDYEAKNPANWKQVSKPGDVIILPLSVHLINSLTTEEEAEEQDVDYIETLKELTDLLLSGRDHIQVTIEEFIDTLDPNLKMVAFKSRELKHGFNLYDTDFDGKRQPKNAWLTRVQKGTNLLLTISDDLVASLESDAKQQIGKDIAVEEAKLLIQELDALRGQTVVARVIDLTPSDKAEKLVSVVVPGISNELSLYNTDFDVDETFKI